MNGVVDTVFSKGVYYDVVKRDGSGTRVTANMHVIKEHEVTSDKGDENRQ